MSTILTWIVHGSVLVTLATLAMRPGRGPNAATRYCLWWAVMAALLAMPVAHAISTPAPVAVERTQAADGPLVTETAVTPAERPLIVVPHQIAAAAPWVIALIAGLVCWRLVALARAAARLHRVRARCAPLPDGLEAQLPLWCAARHRVRRVQLLATLDLPTPAVLGAPPGEGGPPIIALPLWTIETLDADSLDLIVLHELAHVERGDDRDLLVQSAIETIFCWHPAVRWVGRQLDDERERACDDEVVRRTDRAAQYARCLLGVAAYAAPVPVLLAAPGVGRAGRRLAARVERLLAESAVGEPPRARARRIAWMGASLTWLTCAVVVSAAGAPRVHVPEPNWGRIRTSAMTSLVMSAHSGPLKVALREAPPRPAEQPMSALAPGSPARRAAGARVRPAPESSGPDLALDESPREAPAFEPARAGDPWSDPASMVGAAVGFEPPSFTSGGLLPSMSIVPASLQTPSAPTPLALAAPPIRPWKRPADAGGYIGRGAALAGESIGKSAALAGVKTAGFFSRMGRAVASSF